MDSTPQAGRARPTAQDPSDGSLLRRYRGGNRVEAAEAIYGRYAARLRGLVRSRAGRGLMARFDDEDIVQSAFGRFFRAVDRDLYDVPAGSELWGLLMVITLRRLRSCAAYHQAGRRDVRQTTDEVAVERAGNGRVEGPSLEEAIEPLDAQQRFVARLRLEGYEVAEIAQRIGRSKRSVERILKECRIVLTRSAGE